MDRLDNAPSLNGLSTEGPSLFVAVADHPAYRRYSVSVGAFEPGADPALERRRVADGLPPLSHLAAAAAREALAADLRGGPVMVAVVEAALRQAWTIHGLLAPATFAIDDRGTTATWVVDQVREMEAKRALFPSGCLLHVSLYRGTPHELLVTTAGTVRCTINDALELQGGPHPSPIVGDHASREEIAYRYVQFGEAPAQHDRLVTFLPQRLLSVTLGVRDRALRLTFDENGAVAQASWAGARKAAMTEVA